MRRRDTTSPELALHNLELYRTRPDQMKIELPEPRASSLLCGETGVLLVAWRLAPSRQIADDLLSRVRANVIGRYSLWTGDLGVAVYPADCLDARSAYPFFDRRS